MNSSTAMTSTPSTLQDPIVRLPRELFFQLFTHIEESKLILDSSTVSREWRDVILSSPSTFEHLYINSVADVLEEENSLAQRANANSMIIKLSGFANLSNNRLKSVKLTLPLFPGEAKVAYSNWNSTRFPIIFNTLNWSSSTLTTLNLVFVVQEEVLSVSLSDGILHMVAVIKNLDRLKSLRNVAIESYLGVTLKSSGSSRTIEIHDGDVVRQADEIEVDGTHGSTLAILFNQVAQFTGNGIEEVTMTDRYLVSLDALKELERSKEVLQELELELNADDELSTFKCQLEMKCSSLIRLNLVVWGRESTEEDRDFINFKVADWRGNFNQLKHFRLYIDHVAVAPLFIQEDFFRNSSLESIVVRVEGWSDTTSPIIDLQSLHQLLLSSSSSLQYLNLSGMKLSAGITEGLQLHQLVTLIITGDATLIDFFLDIGYTSLKKLNLDLWIREGEADRIVEHCKVIQILKCCQVTLQEFSIFCWASTNSASLETEGTVSEDHHKSFTLPKLRHLDLGLEDEVIIKHYLLIDYPNLSRVWLRRSSKLSQADFSLQRQDSTLG